MCRCVVVRLVEGILDVVVVVDVVVVDSVVVVDVVVVEVVVVDVEVVLACFARFSLSRASCSCFLR